MKVSMISSRRTTARDTEARPSRAGCSGGDDDRGKVPVVGTLDFRSTPCIYSTDFVSLVADVLLLANSAIPRETVLGMKRVSNYLSEQRMRTTIVRTVETH